MAAVVFEANKGDDDDTLAERLFEMANQERVQFPAARPGDAPLVVRQDASIPHTGGCVWETCVLLMLYARARWQQRAQQAASGGARLRCLEVGAGCGLLSLALSRMGFDVTATEQPGVLENLQHNIERDSARAPKDAGACRAVRLRWGDADDIAALLGSDCSEARFDLIVGTDVVYKLELVEPLLHTLRKCTAPTGSVYLCLQRRCVASHERLLHRAPCHFERVSEESIDGFELARDFVDELECLLLKLEGPRAACSD